MAKSYEDVTLCTTPGDALDAVYIFDHKFDKEAQEFTSTIRVSQLNDTHVDYTAVIRLQDLKKPSFVDVVIAKSKDSIDFGGASTKSIMLAFSDDMQSAKMAEGSFVYHLSCKQYDKLEVYE